MKAIEESEGKPIASNGNTFTTFCMPQEAIKLGGGDKIMDMKYLCRSMEDIMGELRNGSRSVTPEIIDLMGGYSTKLEELTSSIAEENGSDNIGVKVMKIKMANPIVHVEDYNGPINILKSMCKDGKRFSITLRFDLNSFNDLQNFIDYFTELTEKSDTANMPFTKNEYRTNLDVVFLKPVIVKED